MNQSVLLLLILLLICRICPGQDKASPSGLAPEKSGMEKENKNIGLNYITTDSLTITEFLHCDKITVKNSKVDKITFYRLTYFIPAKNGGQADMRVLSEYSDKLDPAFIREIVLAGVGKILIENIMGISRSKTIRLGHRWFYLKE